MNSRKVKVLYLGVLGCVWEEPSLSEGTLSLRRLACTRASGDVPWSQGVFDLLSVFLAISRFYKTKALLFLIENFAPKERDSGPRMGGALFH